jgi:hypothetical protein
LAINFERSGVARPRRGQLKNQVNQVVKVRRRWQTKNRLLNQSSTRAYRPEESSRGGQPEHQRQNVELGKIVWQNSSGAIGN